MPRMKGGWGEQRGSKTVWGSLITAIRITSPTISAVRRGSTRPTDARALISAKSFDYGGARTRHVVDGSR
jgi:hypothetical protein